ncbi:hypothetical protein J2Z26_000058 [Bacillus luteolus]|nr:hypothetical protein [Cytobacillus luteolus]
MVRVQLFHILATWYNEVINNQEGDDIHAIRNSPS